MLPTIGLTLIMAGGCITMSGQQALVLDGSQVVAIKGQSIILMNKELSRDEATFISHNRVYPNQGPSYWTVAEGNAKKFNVLDHLTVREGKILYDGVAVEVGGKAFSLYQAVSWGDLVACLGVFQITHRKTAWWEGDRVHALVVFSPKDRKGAHEFLTMASKRNNYRLDLIDPISSSKRESSHQPSNQKIEERNK